METWQSLINWVNSNPILCWLIIYAMIYFVIQVIGCEVGVWMVGMVVGISVINGVSIVFAYFATNTQPLWVTLCVFFVTVSVGLIVIYFKCGEYKSIKDKSDES